VVKPGWAYQLLFEFYFLFFEFQNIISNILNTTLKTERIVLTKVEIIDGRRVIRMPDKSRTALDYPQRWDLLEMGDKATFRKTITDGDISMFAGATGDTNPYHFDDVYASKGRFKKRIAHGMLVTGLISTVLGTCLPGPGTIYLSQTISFKKPVFIGDTITAVAEVTNIHETKPIVTMTTNCYNQNDEPVVEGEAVVLVEYVDME
jgi:3-hydroxybutyryl-CoA dehydratase